MSSNVSVTRKIAWIALLPQFVFAMLLIFAWHLAGAPDPPLYGLATYLIVALSLRTFVPKNHNKGMKLVARDKFEEAIPHFEKSFEFFTRNTWIDKYRFITLLSASGMSYREMSLTNIALCYEKLDNTSKSKEYYEKTLREYPESEIARSGLNLLEN
jgi:tetratricopeptide (TPR) repeat protein